MARILIIDDEPLTLDLLTAYLEIIGHESVGATSVRQAHDRLAYEEPDALLLDIMLPDGNGIDMCRELRETGLVKNAPIIIISAHAPPMNEQAEAAGADAYLSKPIKLDALRITLENHGVFT